MNNSKGNNIIKISDTTYFNIRSSSLARSLNTLSVVFSNVEDLDIESLYYKNAQVHLRSLDDEMNRLLEYNSADGVVLELDFTSIIEYLKSNLLALKKQFKINI